MHVRSKPGVYILCILYILAMCVGIATAEVAESSECEVCVAVVDRFYKAVGDTKPKSQDQWDSMIRRICSQVTHPKEKRFCWYIGASRDSATNIFREITRPMSFNMPSLNLCKKLQKIDSIICGLRYSGPTVVEESEEKPTPPAAVATVDWDNLSKLRIRQLKQILDNWNEFCSGCVEKSDFIARIQELRPKYESKSEL
uniref:Mesencephalic astrocyte-derived neurotrophic factor homolog n=1 Tax=Lygus hesperus TaxID=30085 RepID=A0A0A9YE26_LYGHE